MEKDVMLDFITHNQGNFKIKDTPRRDLSICLDVTKATGSGCEDTPEPHTSVWEEITTIAASSSSFMIHATWIIF